MSRSIIGGITDPYKIEQRVITLNSDIKILDDVIFDETHRIAQKVGKQPLTEAEKQAGKVSGTFQNFKLEWSAFLADGAYVGDSDKVRAFEVRFREIYYAWNSLADEIDKPKVAISTLPAEPSLLGGVPTDNQLTALTIGGGIFAAALLYSLLKK
jgi:hypothetical protein